MSDTLPEDRLTPSIPPQTPLYHALQKDRYARQQAIRDIETITKRELIVYFARLDSPNAAIGQADIPPFCDALQKLQGRRLDLLLQSPGGDIDKAEKLVYICRQATDELRVIVPESAKSAATLVALAADSIMMSDTSELGPIDPQVTITTAVGTTVNRPARSFLDGLEAIKRTIPKDEGLSPAYFPLLAHLDPALIDFCEKAIDRARAFAVKWLERYMCRGRPEDAQTIAEQLLSVETYLSHGMVIDAQEAVRLGLIVEREDFSGELWQRVWRLYCAYEVDSRRDTGFAKIVESSTVSIPMS